ncbi:unnamed protein product, partial [Rotaria sp. Silwood1]
MTDKNIKVLDIEIKYTQIFVNSEWHKVTSVAAAKKASAIKSTWRKYQPAERGNLLRKLADLLRRDVDYLSKLATLNGGEIINNSVGEVFASAACFDYDAGWADKNIPYTEILDIFS